MTGEQFTVRYADRSESLTVRLIHQWNRGDIGGPVMSASSGPKDYIKNQVWQAFSDTPSLDAVMMVRANGLTFVIFQRGGEYFDATGKQVAIKEAHSK